MAIGHGLHQLPQKLYKRNLALYTPTGYCFLAATPKYRQTLAIK
jgi:hypothetical protein